MYQLRRFLLLFPWNRRRRERELEEELNANLAFALDDAGPGADRGFGNLTRAREESRAVWLPWDAVWQDVRFSLRALRRSPAFTLVAIVSLGLGIGAAAALFSLVNTVVLKPLAYREPGKLLFVREVVKPLAHIYPTMPVNYQHFLFWRENTRAFESIAALMGGSAVLTSRGDPENIGIGFVSAEFFDALGATPLMGRSFQRGEDGPHAPREVILTDGLWRRRFGASPSIVGQTIRLADNPFRVIGVLPPTFRFPKNRDLGPLAGLPERIDAFIPIRNFVQGWGGDYDYIVFARLRHGVSEAQGAAELNLLEERIVEAHPEVSPGLRVAARPLQGAIASPVQASLTVLLAAVLVLLLIVCVNLANLLLARGGARAREYSMRIALGASRGRLMVSALMETLLLSVAGGALGVAGASAAVVAFARFAPIDLPRADEARVDARVLAFAFGLSFLCALIFGLLPALRLSQADPQIALRGETHGATAVGRSIRMREWLVGGEVALSTLLLVLAGLLVGSLWRVLHVDRGFATEYTLVVSPTVPASYQVKDVAPFFDRAVAALRELPGVKLAAAVSQPPLTGESSVNDVSVDGATDEALDPVSHQRIEVNDRFLSGEYFAAVGLPILRGRDFEPADRDRNVAVISSRLAAELFPGREPLGHTVTSGSRISGARIVGVAGDTFTTQLDRDPTPMIYVPNNKLGASLMVRTSVDPRALEPDIRRAIQALAPGVPAPKMRTMQELVDESTAQRRFEMEIAAGFGIAAVLLTALGIYGVVAYGVSLRRREVGVRMALGARAAEVRRMIVRRGLLPVLAGLAAGLAGAVAAGNLVRSLLFGVTPNDPRIFAGVGAALLSVALLASLLPAHRAARTDPARVLREE